MTPTVTADALLRMLQATPEQVTALHTLLSTMQAPGAGGELRVVWGRDGDAPARGMTGGERLGIGRFSYLPGYQQVWLGEEFFDLSQRSKARACIRFLVERQAFDRKSACHLEREIDPFVRKECELPNLPGCSETKMHYYFNPTTSRTAKLGRALIKSAGRGTGRYFLNVD